MSLLVLLLSYFHFIFSAIFFLASSLLSHFLYLFVSHFERQKRTLIYQPYGKPSAIGWNKERKGAGLYGHESISLCIRIDKSIIIHQIFQECIAQRKKLIYHIYCSTTQFTLLFNILLSLLLRFRLSCPIPI